MQVGELFVNLGITGAEKSVAAVTGVRKGMQEVGSSSLAAKAGILGVLYGFEQLVQGSNASGNSLMQFAAYTGLSMDRLQRWQYLLRQSGVNSEEAQASFEGLQKVMYQISHGLGGTAGMKYISEVLNAAGKGIDWKRAGTDTDYMMGKMREFMKLSHDIPRANQAAAEMGLTRGTALSFRTSSVDLDQVPRNQLYSDKQSAALQKMNVAWSNMGQEIEHMIGGLNTQFGPQLVKDLQTILPIILDTVKAFAKLAQQIQLVAGIGKIFEGWGIIFKTIGDAVNSITSDKDGGLMGLLHLGGKAVEGAEGIIKDFGGGLLNELHTNYRRAHLQYENQKQIVNNHTTTINSTIHGVQNGEEAAVHLQRQLNKAKVKVTK